MASSASLLMGVVAAWSRYEIIHSIIEQTTSGLFYKSVMSSGKSGVSSDKAEDEGVAGDKSISRNRFGGLLRYRHGKARYSRGVICLLETHSYLRDTTLAEMTEK